ncbi:choice-of-anchor Q domain-containing protein, partial [Lysobacter sp. D1-1-M9]
DNEYACPSGSICGKDPMLADMTLRGFNAEPRDGSPVIDKVSVLAGIDTDFLLQPRPVGTASDVGAYEMQVGGIISDPDPIDPIDPVDPTCTRGAPTLSISGPTTAVAAGTTSTFDLALRNNDSTACSNTTFNLARTVPSGWTGTLSANSVALAPGATGKAAIQVTSPTTATAGSYGIGAGASSTEGSVHTQSASATYQIEDSSSTSTDGLTSSVGTDKTQYVGGETVHMSARVLHNGKPVSGVKVRFGALKPNGINEVVEKATTDSNGYARASFVSGSGQSSIGTYQLRAETSRGSHSAIATSTFSVADPDAATATGMTETVATDKTSYVAGETVHMSARVLNNGKAVSGAEVRFGALKPNGINEVVEKAITDSNGYARASFVSGSGPSSIGAYQLRAEATSGSLSATASSTFSVADAGTGTEVATATGMTETVATDQTSYVAGETVHMSARVLNNGKAVSGAEVRFGALKPNGINEVVEKAVTDSNGYARASFVSGSGPSSIGTYQLRAEATSGSLSATASSTFSVADEGVAQVEAGFTDTVATSKSSYDAGETVYMSARVLHNGKPVAGANVRFGALKPNGINEVVEKATTDSNGYARASFVSGSGPSSIGTYQLRAEATSGSESATASGTFSVG